jgi:hypothetical protein
MTTQSRGMHGQRFAAFLGTIIALNFTMWFSTAIHASAEVASQVIVFECAIGGVLVLGRSAVHIGEAWANAKRK